MKDLEPMDDVNRRILELLRGNARLSWQQIGQEVHLSGQAVAARVAQMEDKGVIQGFTLREEASSNHFVSVFMETADFARFEAYLQARDGVLEAYKVAGDACYQVVFRPPAGETLDEFLVELLRFGRYRVLSVLRCVKP